MSGSDASYTDNDNIDHPPDDDDDDDYDHDDDDVVDDTYIDNDAGDNNDAAATQQQRQEEINESLKKMEKIVNNLIARADSVPFREPGEFPCC
jgi:hypothetical protein